MRSFTYVLRFVRPAGVADDAPAIAESADVSTVIGVRGVRSGIVAVPGGKAVLNTTATVGPDGALFFETGTICFGSGDDALSYQSIGAGVLGDCADPRYKAGTVMWKVTAGTGFFQGATGNITSNFLLGYDVAAKALTSELIDHHFGLLFLPE